MANRNEDARQKALENFRAKQSKLAANKINGTEGVEQTIEDFNAIRAQEGKQPAGRFKGTEILALLRLRNRQGE